MIDSICILIDDFIKKNTLQIYSEKFEEELKKYVLEILTIQFQDFPSECDNLDKNYKLGWNEYFKNYPPRCSGPTFCNNINKKNLDSILEHLKNVYQPEQKSDEWYNFRHNFITASSAWKAFGSQSVKNQLIYEKCCPIDVNKYRAPSGNSDSPLAWGTKYEDVSIMYYENLYNTHVNDYGCIPHEKYAFLAASPDGINVKKDSPLYGRMLEIKNIVNRKIDGNPKFEYWIQMQLQMEVCNLDECDFLETQFVEYENYNESNYSQTC